MNSNHPTRLNFVLRLSIVGLLSLIFASPLLAQGLTDGQTPLGLTRGAPVGSYPLSDFENINLYNGSLNFSLPLLTITGRGGTEFPIVLRIDQKWTMSKEINPGHAAYHFGHSTW